MEFLIAYGYIGVFIASFLAATILPFSSEVVLTGVLANPIPGLFVAGVDGDFWAVPYFEGGSAQGFCVGSGYLAGVTAAQG